MSKIITFIFVVLVLVYVFFLHRFRMADPSNIVNQRLRPLFLRSAIARKALFLNETGDGRFEYLSPDKVGLFVEVDYQSDRQPGEGLEEWVEDLVGETLRKDVDLHIAAERRIPDQLGFSDKELRRIAKLTEDGGQRRDQAYLHVLYVSKSEEAPSNTGLVLTAKDIFIFRDGIDALADKESIRDRIEESTLKHEFGHLLGLEHIERDECVMSEKVEVYEKRRYQFVNIPLDFCGESFEELRRIRSSAF